MSSHVTWRIRKLSLRLLTDTPIIRERLTFKIKSQACMQQAILSLQVMSLTWSNCLTRYLSESCNLSAAWSWFLQPGRRLPGWRWAAGDEAWTRSGRTSPLAHCTVGGTHTHTRSQRIEIRDKDRKSAPMSVYLYVLMSDHLKHFDAYVLCTLKVLEAREKLEFGFTININVFLLSGLGRVLRHFPARAAPLSL